jgi:hypothetical protein
MFLEPERTGSRVPTAPIPPQWPKGMAPPWLVVERLVPGREPFRDFVALKRFGLAQGVAIWGESWPTVERVREGDVWRRLTWPDYNPAA